MNSEKKFFAILLHVFLCALIFISLAIAGVFTSQFSASKQINQSNSSSLLNSHSNASDVNRSLVYSSPGFQSPLGFKIRSNPTNGFNSLTTPDGEYSFVLITKDGASEDPANYTIGGSNSGIACIGRSGNVIDTWYIPDGEEFAANYTTNIVFGQDIVDGRHVFVPSRIFVLLGISNLAYALNRAFTSYDQSTGELTNSVQSAPTIKIFKLNINYFSYATSGASFFSNALSGKNFYNFGYPLKNKNIGQAGFSSGNFFLPEKMSYVDPNSQTTNSFVYSSFNISSSSKKDWWNYSVRNQRLVAFGSYLTYLTYGQNFAYHLGSLSSKYANKDEFLMTSSFVNVDQNLGGLYSAIAPTDVQSSFGDQPLQQNYIKNQTNWPMPFGYQWLLASIASEKNNVKVVADAKDGIYFDLVQYQFLDSSGNPRKVYWSRDNSVTSLALSWVLISCLSNRNMIDKGLVKYINGFGDYLTFLRSRNSFGANWGLTNGYIIFTPSKSVMPGTRITVAISDYRFYQISKMSLNPMNSNLRQDDFIFGGLVFTNVLATDQVVLTDQSYTRLSHQIDYVLTLVFPDKLYGFDSGVVTKDSLNQKRAYLLTPLAIANSDSSLTVCYTWGDISNDDFDSGIVISLANSKKDDINTGYLFWGDAGTYVYSQYSPEYGLSSSQRSIISEAFDLKYWNLVYLGGESTLSRTSFYDTEFATFGDWDGLAPNVFRARTINPWQAISYMQRKISFALFVYHGVIIMTAPSSVEWRPSFYVWVVSAIGKNKDSSIHWQFYNSHAKNCYRVNLNQNDYWFADGKEKTSVEYYDLKPAVVEAVLYLNSSMSSQTGTLAFVTTKGIYTIAGDNSWLFNTIIYTSDSNLGNLFDIYSDFNNAYRHDEFNSLGYFNKNNVKALDNQLLSSNVWTAYSDDVGSLLVSSFAVPVGNNFLYVIGNIANGKVIGSSTTIISADSNSQYKVPLQGSLYSLQTGYDYLIKITSGNSVFDAEFNEHLRAKPILVVNSGDNFANYSDFSAPTAFWSQYNFPELLVMEVEQLLKALIFAGWESDHFTVDYTYKYTSQLPLVQPFGYTSQPSSKQSVSFDSTRAEILIPIKFTNFAQNIIYFLPMRMSDGSYQAFWALQPGSLKSSNFRSITFVLNSSSKIRETLLQQKLTVAKLSMPSSTKSVDVDKIRSELSDKIEKIFFNINATDPTNNKRISQEITENEKSIFGSKYIFSVTPSALGSSVGNVQVRLRAGNGWYPLDKIVPAENDVTSFVGGIGYQCDLFYAPPVLNLGIIIGSIVCAIVVISVALGLGIGLSLRKQSRIIQLKSQITNSRIKKLSPAVQVPFRNFVGTTFNVGAQQQRALAPRFHYGLGYVDRKYLPGTSAPKCLPNGSVRSAQNLPKLNQTQIPPLLQQKPKK